MKRPNQGINLTDDEVRRAFGDLEWAKRYSPVLNVAGAAKLAGVSENTIYDWSSRGLLKGCSRRVGRRLRIFRDRFLKFLFN